MGMSVRNFAEVHHEMYHHCPQLLVIPPNAAFELGMAAFWLSS